MKKSQHLIILYILLAVSGGSAVYFFMQSNYYRNQLSVLEETNQNDFAKQGTDKSLLVIDSLLLEKNYEMVLKEYERLLSNADSSQQPALYLGMRLVKELMYNQANVSQTKDSIDSKSFSEEQNLTNSVLENKLYDSLTFSLVKANVQIESLKKRLKNARSGEYLKFINSKGNEVYYVGQLKTGKANGEGVALLSTGSRYEGEWQNNLRHGKGVFYWPDGAYYEGFYQNDKREGLGTYHWPNGEKFTGQWKSDKRNGAGAFYDKDEKVTIKGIWQNDELVKRDK